MTSALWQPALVSLLWPTTLLLAVPLLRLAAKRGPNWYFGYRTAKSMSSRKRWALAQNEMSKWALWIGVGSLIIGIITFLVLYLSGNRSPSLWWSTTLALAILPLVPIVFGIVNTENRLK